MEAHEGIYVRYPSEELYAVLSLESHRHGALIVGEDLGTVPRYVRSGMARHGVQRSYVVQFELQPSRAEPLAAIPRASMASLNTHDMPPFTAFWRGLDIGERLERGLLDDKVARSERKSRQALKRSLLAFLKRTGAFMEAGQNGEETALRACLAFLSASRARLVLVSLEDLWSETQPQNVPGTSERHPNWRRKARYALEGFQQGPEVIKILRQVDGLRK
jgi:4-alpha-glucanotransferase